MNANEEKYGPVATHRGWTITRTGDGLVALDEQGSNCLPGGIWFRTVEDARNGINDYLLANRDADVFWMLGGGAGTDSNAIQSTVQRVDGSVTVTMGRKERPTIAAFKHRVEVSKDGFVSMQPSNGVTRLSPESALVLSNALRDAAKIALRIRRGDKYVLIG